MMTDGTGRTPLEEAVQRGEVERVRLLLRYGADVTRTEGVPYNGECLRKEHRCLPSVRLRGRSEPCGREGAFAHFGNIAVKIGPTILLVPFIPFIGGVPIRARRSLKPSVYPLKRFATSRRCDLQRRTILSDAYPYPCPLR